MLRDRDDRRLVVRRRIDAREAVHARGEALVERRGELAVLRGVVEALEEGKDVRVGWFRGLERVEELDDDVRVAADLALAVELLSIREWISAKRKFKREEDPRSCEIVFLRIHKEARLHPLNRHPHGKRLILIDHLEVLREHKLGARHIIRARDQADRRGVARAGLDLLAVSEGERVEGRETEVDEVVGGGE